MKVMSGLDARFLYSETTNAHMHTMKVVVVDLAARTEPLSPEDLPELIEERVRALAGCGGFVHFRTRGVERQAEAREQFAAIARGGGED